MTFGIVILVSQSTVHKIFLKKKKQWKDEKQQKISEIAYNLFYATHTEFYKDFLDRDCTSPIETNKQTNKHLLFTPSRSYRLSCQNPQANTTWGTHSNKFATRSRCPQALKWMCIYKSIINFSLINTIFSNSAGEGHAILQSWIK